MEENKNLRAIFRSLPDEIKDWFSSERITYIVADLNDRLNIKEEREKIIPRLILRLLTQDLEPRDFISTLAIKLNVSDSAAKIITKEIETKILHPIEDSLRVNIGVDIAMLHLGKEVGDISQLKKDVESGVWGREEGKTETKPETEPIEIEPHIGERQGLGSRVQGVTEKTEEDTKSSGPFILHTEKEAVKPITQPPKSTFSIKIPLGQKKYTGGMPQLRQAPQVTARIETGEEENLKQTQRPKEGLSSPSVLPPLRRLGDVKYGMGDMGQNDEGSQPKPPLAIPRAVRPQGESKRRIESNGDAVETATPQIKKVVHYSQWLTPLE